jgi:hypothetical protein
LRETDVVGGVRQHRQRGRVEGADGRRRHEDQRHEHPRRTRTRPTPAPLPSSLRSAIRAGWPGRADRRRVRARD